MKKLICAAVVAGSMFAVAEEPAPAEVPAAPAVAEAVKVAPKRPQVSEEQRAKMREQRGEKFMAERKAQTEARLLEVVKKYVPEEEKAKALVKELQDTLMAGRRNMMRRPMAPAAKPAVEKPAEAK